MKVQWQVMMNDLPNSYSEGTAQNERIIELGRKLVDELDHLNSSDTLGLWMAHYIAELIARAESAPTQNADAAKHECFTAIIALWKHRAGMKNGSRPFEELEPVARTITSLDPENDFPRYFRQARPPADEETDSAEQAQWLELANRLDHTAKVLIRYCLAEAAESALDKSKEWVRLASDIEDNSSAKVIVRFLSKATEETKEPSPNEAVRSLLNERVSRLHVFIDTAQSVADHLEQRLQLLYSDDDADRQD